MTASDAAPVSEAILDRIVFDVDELVLDSRKLSRNATVRFPVRRIATARLLWLNHGWFLEHSVDTFDPTIRSALERELLERYAVLSLQNGISGQTPSIEDWLEADLYGGTGGATHGGSGRCGISGDLNAKGIGRTPLVPDDVDALHRSGFLSLREAVREVVAAEVCRAELPFGAVPILAIIDTGLTHRSAPCATPERCAIVVRPNFVRPAHFERSIFFGESGSPTSHQFIDACRVVDAVRTLDDNPKAYPSLKEMFTRFARQLGASRARRLWQGRFLSSNLSIDGALIDFGALRTVPSWRKCLGLAGECFGTEMSQLRLALGSVLFYYAKYSARKGIDFEFDTFVAELVEVEDKAFLDTCLRSLGVPSRKSGDCERLETLLGAYYRQQQETTVGDSPDGEGFSIYALLSGTEKASAASTADLSLARQLIEEIDRLAEKGLPISRARAIAFFEPRRELNYATSSAAAGALEGRIMCDPDAASLVGAFIEEQCALAIRFWPLLPTEFEVIRQATDVASAALVCRDCSNGDIVLHVEGPISDNRLHAFGGVLRVEFQEGIVGRRRVGWLRRHLSSPEEAGSMLNRLGIESQPRFFTIPRQDSLIGGACRLTEEGTHHATGYVENAHERRMSAEYGHALRLNWATQGEDVELGALSRRLWPAVRLNQIMFLFTSKGAPAGYVTWAFLTESSVARLRADPDYIPHLSEWNEGDQVWLIDVVSMPGKARNLLRKLRDRRLPSVTRIQSGRRKNRNLPPRPIDLRVFRAVPGEGLGPTAGLSPSFDTWRGGAG